MALLEEARARLDYEDADLSRLLSELMGRPVDVKGSLNVWRNRKRISREYRAPLLTVITDRLRPDEQAQARIERRLDEVLDKVRGPKLEERLEQVFVKVQHLDEVLEKVRGIEEVRGLLQRYIGPPPGSQKRARGGDRP